MIPTNNSSLVKYDNPVLVSRSDKSTKAGAAAGASPDKQKQQAATKAKLPPVEDKTGGAKPGSQTEDILNSILPPKWVPTSAHVHLTPNEQNREWEESGQLWVQRVSSTPATRLDVINLQVSSLLYFDPIQSNSIGFV